MTDEELDAAIEAKGREWRLDQIKLNEKENELRALRRERDRRRSMNVPLPGMKEAGT